MVILSKNVLEKYPMIKNIGEVVCLGTIFFGVAIFLILSGKQLLASGYPKKRVKLFITFSMLTSLPIAFLGSYTTSMLHRSFNGWRAQLFFDSMLHSPSHTLHAGLILFMVFGALFCFLLRWKFFDVFDAVCLYLPLTQAFVGLFWLLFGCWQGKYIAMKLYGLYLNFQNPTPLYAIIADLGIYLFLKRLHAVVHSGRWLREHMRGVVFASYLLIYAVVRILLNVFENEHGLYFNLTQTQFTMATYILFSISIFLMVFCFHHKFKSAPHPGNHINKDFDNLKRLLFAAGLTVSYLAAIFLIYYLTRQLRVWKWPFQPVASLSDAYARIFYYMPVMSIPAWALVWMKKFNEPIRPWFKWGRFSNLFLIGLVASSYYSIELLVLKQPTLRGAEFWPPAIILSIMNAFSEEIMYRLALYRAIVSADYSKWTALIVQCLIYSLIHFMIAGAILGLFSLAYGFLLGLIVQRGKSVTPAIICHFIIDIGCIGMPILRI